MDLEVQGYLPRVRGSKYPRFLRTRGPKTTEVMDFGSKDINAGYMDLLAWK